MTDQYFLSHGSHETREQGMCAMEWVSYLAGLEHSDAPVCVSPVLREYGIALNDRWGDEQRQKLRPYLARCIGTAGDGRDIERGFMAMDWLLREFTPAFLDLVPSLHAHAERLRGLPPVVAVEGINHAMALVQAAQKDAAAVRDAAWAAAGAAVRDAARDAVRDAARDAVRDAVRATARDAAWDAVRAAARDAAGAAAWDAAWDAAWAAAGAAAWDAAGAAAWDAAWDAVRAAARAAARDAARAAARAALKPTVVRLQASALDLFDRMLPTELIEVPVAVDWEAVVGPACERSSSSVSR